MPPRKVTLKPSNSILKRVWHYWKPTGVKTVSEWADKKRILTRKTSPIHGRWKTSTFPPAKEPMDAYSNPLVRKIILKFPTQSSKTEIMLNCKGWMIDESPGPTLDMYPTDNVLDKVSEDRIKDMIMNCPSLREKLISDTLAKKTFIDMIYYLATAQSGSTISSTPIENLFGDELKDFPQFTSQGKGADPLKYGEDRLKAYSNTSKVMYASSPLLATGKISVEFRHCLERVYLHYPCIHCGEYQRLMFFERVYWEEKDGLEDTDPELWDYAKKTAYYVCPYCGGVINDEDKLKMMIDYRWLREDRSDPNLDAESIGFELGPSHHSPFITFGAMAKEYYECKNEPEKWKNFITGWLGADYEQKAIKTSKEQILQARCSLPPLVAPAEAVLLTAGIDCQKNGFWYAVRAWARDWTSWLIDYGYLLTWDDVDSLLYLTFYPRDGEDHKVMPISRACLDTGGGEGKWGLTMTNEAYMWLSARKFKQPCKVWGTRGDPSPHPGRLFKVAKVEATTQGQKLKYPVQRIDFNTGMMKMTLHQRLIFARDEAVEAAYLHCDTNDQYANHILAEELQIDQKGNEEWVKVATRNDLLDCECLCMLAADKEFPMRPALNMLREPINVSHQSSEPAKREVKQKQGFIPKPRNSLFERGRRLL